MSKTSTPIAIIGAGCQVPGCRDLDAFTKFLLDGRSAIAQLPADRFDPELYYDGKRGTFGKSYCWKGAMFDVQSIPTPVVPMLRADQASRLLPLHKLALNVAAEAFASAGFDAPQLAGRDIPVFLGGSRPPESFDHMFAHAIEYVVAPLDDAMTGDRRASEIRAEIVRSVRERYHACGDDTTPAVLGRQVAGTVANAFGLTGRHAVLDAACASTLSAVHLGVRALEQRTNDLALVGGASFFNPYTLVMFAMSRSLTDDNSFPFDARASGFIPGEGAGMFVLERLDDALANRRRILGVIRGVGSSCDGSGKGTWAPRKEGQVLAIERAYECGAVDPAEVGMIEAHATSTRLGDATEVGALAEVFGRGGKRAPIHITGVKSNFGHLIASAGAVGIAKVIATFRANTIAPTIGYTAPNPDIHWDRVPLRLVTAPTPWPADGPPRVAGVDSFGIGGLNYHVVIEGPPTPARAKQLLDRAAPTPRASVAIVGTGTFLAGARTRDELARVVTSGRGRTRRLPRGRLALDIFQQRGAPAPWRTRVEEAAVADDPTPDAQKLKIPPKLLANYDPLQFMILDASTQALDSLRDRATLDKQRIAVFVGSSYVNDFYVQLTLAVRLAEVARLVDRALASRGVTDSTRTQILASYIDRARQLLPPLTEESSANTASALASRTAKTFDVHGTVVVIDAGGTASGLAALEFAVAALRAGDCDVAIAGGGDRALRIDRQVDACEWDECGRSSGEAWAPGEGAAMFALRRLDDATRAGDAVAATVAAIGGASTGSLARARHADPAAVERAIERAFAHGGVAQADVQYVAGDVLGAGDAADLVALERRYGGGGAPLAIGSPVPLFGLCDGATSGAAVQMALVAMHDGVAPPSPALVARLGAARGRLAWSAESRPLPAARDAAVAVTSASGWGSSYHVVLAPPAKPHATVSKTHATATTATTAKAPEPVVFRAESRAALWSLLQAQRDRLARVAPGDTIGRGDVAVALRASTLADSLAVALTAVNAPDAAAFASQGVAVWDGAPLDVAASCVLFPGLGSPYEGMLRALVDAYPTAAKKLAELDALIVARAGRTLSHVLAHEPKALVETVEWAQYGSLAANLVTHEVAAAHGVAPRWLSGHSFGEIAALVVAGALALDTAVAIAALRADAIARHTRPGAMASVFASKARVVELCAGVPGFAAPSNVNSPDEVVVSGDLAGIAALVDRCRAANVQARQLAVPAPFHCELLRPACEPFARAIATLPIAAPNVRVISSTTSRELREPDEIRRALVAQLVTPVDWIAQIDAAYAAGARRFIETGAGNVLARLTAKILGARRAVVVSFDERRKREKVGLLAVENALAALRASEPAAGATAAVASPPAVAPPSFEGELFSADEWRALAAQPDWNAFWVQARPSLALFARDLYSRSQPAGEARASIAAAPAAVAADATPAARPPVKMFDATTMRAPPAPPRVAAAPPAPAAPAPAPVAPLASTPPSNGAPAHADSARRTEDVSKLLVELVVQHTGYPRELVRFEQELEADLGIDTVKQVELLGAIRQHFDVAADESVTVSDLPTLAHLRDHIVARLGVVGGAAPALRTANKGLVEEVSGLLVDLVVQRTGRARELVRFDEQLEAARGIDLLATARELLDLPAEESGAVFDLPTLAQLRDHLVDTLERGAPPQPAPAPSANLVDEVSGLLTDLVVQHTGYPRELVRFDQELEADLGIDTVKQVELLGAVRERLDLPADESVTVADLPTLAQLRDYIVARLSAPRSK